MAAAVAIAVASVACHHRDTTVTWTRDIAPLVWAKCAGCHRPGQSGPFSLLSYRDVADRAKQIEKVTRTRFMPPWKPRRGGPAFANDRSLDDEQIDLLRRWIEARTPEGDPDDLPRQPNWPQGWRLGTPDVVVRMPEPYTVPADGRDVYRNFVLPTNVTGPHWIAAWELRADGATAIHHAIVNLDRRGWARRKDAEDAEPGYPGMDPGDIQAPDGFYLVWTPGKAPSPPVEGTAWQLDTATDLVLQLHLQPTGKPQTIQPEIGLYYADAPPTRPRMTIKIGDPPTLNIAPNDPDYVITDSYVVPADADLLGLFPHAHYLAHTIEVTVALPGARPVPLLRIDDWDFAWQEEYTFAVPQHLPRGSTVAMEIHYDNSDANERNPNHPPQQVRFGERSVDEMGNITLELAPSDPRDLDALRESKYRRLIARAPNDARDHYNLANTLAREGKRDAAIAEYQLVRKLDPKLAPAAFNLGTLLLAGGDNAGAIVAFEDALRIEPTLVEAELNLGQALGRSGDRDAAVAHFRRALALRPGFALAERALRDYGATP